MREKDNKNKGKGFRLELLLSSVMYVIAGAILLLFPETTARTICYLIAIVVMAIGLIKVLTYLARGLEQNMYKNDLVVGLVCFIIGLVLIFKVKAIISIIPILLGILVLISGFGKLQSSLDVKRMKNGNWTYFFIIALVNIALGLLCIFSPFKIAKTMIRLIGLAMLFSGITDLMGNIYMSKKLKNYLEDMAALEQDIND